MNSSAPNLTHSQSINRAMGFLSGQGHPPTLADFAQAAHLFEQAKDVPFAKAKLAVLCALGCGIEQNFTRAETLYLEAVMGGFPPLLTDMAVILDAHGDADGLVCTLLRRAARYGDMTARYLIVRAGQRGKAYVSADDFAIISESLPKEMPLIAGDYSGGAPIEPAPISQNIMRDAIKAIWSPQEQKKKSLTTEHAVHAINDVLAPLQCDYLIAVSTPLMQPSKVVAESGSLHAGFRTSDGAVILPAVTDMPMVQILFTLAATAGATPEQGEFLSLLRYRPGQEYRPHHDYLSKDEADYSQVGRTGQRMLTLLTYLNAGYDGGETSFPDLEISFKGDVGDALLFANTDEAGCPLPKSRHAGAPVEQGEKWLATLWIREKTFWPWVVAETH